MMNQSERHSADRRGHYRIRLAVGFLVGIFSLGGSAQAQLTLTNIDEMILDSDALVMATSGNFSFVINGSPFQQEVLLTHQGYQYSAWYHNGSSDENIYVSRRSLTGNTWETIDTGYALDNGDDTASRDSRRWDAHNIISMGISGDGRIHLAYDHHVDRLRYLTTDPGVATSAGGTWNASMFKLERDALNLGGTNIPEVTYPRFTNVGDDMVLTYRASGSGNGDVKIADYNSQTGQWSETRFVNRGTVGHGTYDDVNDRPSTRRNAYHNGFHADETGRLHTTWTWREGTQDGNRDINYAYSDDKGVTWRNGDGVLIGTPGSPVTMNSPGIEVADLDRRQAIINQQGQIVDSEGGVHALMFHRRQEPGFEWEPGDGRFSDRPDSAYHHYYRDPLTGEWSVNMLADQAVGGRPRIGVDSQGNLFGIYTESNDLVITAAEKTAIGYSDWEVLLRDDERIYDGTPQVDTVRLLEDGILSIYVQERVESLSETDPTSGVLRVMEFQVNSPTAIPEPTMFAGMLAIAGVFSRRRKRR